MFATSWYTYQIKTRLQSSCYGAFSRAVWWYWHNQRCDQKLNVDDSITPVIQPPRKIPQAMVDPLKQEIERMMMLGVIRKLYINQATDWCHNLVLVRKPNGKLRVCLDPRTINKALRFNIHNARTFQDVTSSIHKITKVSKIDANSGFWTLPMDDQSQLLTTFTLHGEGIASWRCHLGWTKHSTFLNFTWMPISKISIRLPM